MEAERQQLLINIFRIIDVLKNIVSCGSLNDNPLLNVYVMTPNYYDYYIM